MAKVTDEELISCLLKNGGNQHATANELGLSAPTVCHRLKLKHTQALLQKTRQRILDNSINSLISMNNKAVERLENLLDNENAFVRLQAISKIFQYSKDYMTVEDIIKRLDDLETKQQ